MSFFTILNCYRLRLILLFLPLLLSIFFISANIKELHAASSPLPMPLISRNLPVFASSELYPATYANDNDYATQWRGNGSSGWLTYDLSSVPVNQRAQVVLAWYNTDTGAYDHRIIGDLAYNLPNSYTIEANSADGGTNVPVSGWVTLASVSGNHYHSRQHVLDLTGYNWVRMNVSSVSGSSGNSNPSFNLDIHDASTSLEDDWITFGDSITQDGLFQHDLYNRTPTFSQLINASKPDHFPIQEDGGIGYLMSGDGAANINLWLQMFPGKFVTLNYGTNDANGGVPAATFYHNMQTMVDAVLAAGKTPVVPTVPWGCTSGIRNNAPLLNQQIQNLYSAYPQIIPGPDLYAYFQANQNFIGGDCIHPSYPNGMAAYRREWANAMLATVYSGIASSPTPTPSVTPTPTPSETPTPTPTSTPVPTPTPTPVPTPTPTPTPVPTPTPTPSVTPTPTPNPTPIPGAISWVKGAIKSPASAASSTSITLNNIAAGNTLVVSFNVGAGFTQAGSGAMTNTGSSTLEWQQAASRINGQTQVNVWYAYVPVSGDYTITGKATASTALGMAVNEYHGIAQFAPVLATAGAGASSKFPSASSAFTVPEGALVFGSMSWDNGKRTVTPGNGFITRQTFTNASQNQPIATEDRVLTSQASLLANWSLSSASLWDAVVVVFSN